VAGHAVGHTPENRQASFGDDLRHFDFHARALFHQGADLHRAQRRIVAADQRAAGDADVVRRVQVLALVDNLPVHADDEKGVRAGPSVSRREKAISYMNVAPTASCGTIAAN
jgi:hypothetical protein